CRPPCLSQRLSASDSSLSIRRFVASHFSSRICRWNQSRIAGSSGGLLSQHLSLLCNKRSADECRFLARTAIGLLKVDVAARSLAEASTRIVFELYPPTGNACTTPENAA